MQDDSPTMQNESTMQDSTTLNDSTMQDSTTLNDSTMQNSYTTRRLAQKKHAQKVAAMHEETVSLLEEKVAAQAIQLLIAKNAKQLLAEENELLAAELRQTKRKHKREVRAFKAILHRQEETLAKNKQATEEVRKDLTNKLAEAQYEMQQYGKECLVLRGAVKALWKRAETAEAAYSRLKVMLQETKGLGTQEGCRSTDSPTTTEEMTRKPVDYAVEGTSALFSGIPTQQQPKQPKPSVMMTVTSTGCSSWVNKGMSAQKKQCDECWKDAADRT